MERKGEMCTPLAPDSLLGEKNQTLSQEGLEVILKVMEKRVCQEVSGDTVRM